MYSFRRINNRQLVNYYINIHQVPSHFFRFVKERIWVQGASFAKEYRIPMEIRTQWLLMLRVICLKQPLILILLICAHVRKRNMDAVAYPKNRNNRCGYITHRNCFSGLIMTRTATLLLLVVFSNWSTLLRNILLDPCKRLG